MVVPDDASTLADEAHQIRRELRRGRRHTAWRRRLGLARRPSGRARLGPPAMALIISILITLSGLAAVTWLRSTRSGGSPAVISHPTATPTAVGPLPALDLVGTGNTPVPLRSLLPAMIVLVDACVCRERVTEAATTAPSGVTVITVTQARQAEPSPVPGVRALADPAGGLRDYLHLSPHAGTATALLVNREGTLVRVVPELGSVEAYRDDLVHLAA